MKVPGFEYLNRLYRDAPYCINGVGLGFKKVNGVRTSELAVVYHVDKKLQKDLLHESEMIPEKVEIAGQIFPTDIIESKNSSMAGCVLPDSPQAKELRQYQASIAGGLMITSTVHCGVLSLDNDQKNNLILPRMAGTFGGIFKDLSTDTLVGLTAGHIIAKSMIINNEKLGLFEDDSFNNYYNLLDDINLPLLRSQRINDEFSPYFFWNTYQDAPGVSVKKYRQEVFQFQEVNYIDTEVHSIGVPKRYEPLSLNTTDNFIDCGLVALSRARLSLPGSLGIWGLPNTIGMQFATDNEIHECFESETRLYSVGQASGPKLDDCDLIIEEINVQKEIGNYFHEGLFKTSVVYSDLFVVRSRNNFENTFVNGDSGSLIFANINGSNKIIGMVFAVDQDAGYACRITRIADAMGIAPVSYEDAAEYSVDKIGSILVEELAADSSEKTYTSSNTIYSQVGLRQKEDPDLEFRLPSSTTNDITALNVKFDVGQCAFNQVNEFYITQLFSNSVVRVGNFSVEVTGRTLDFIDTSKSVSFVDVFYVIRGYKSRTVLGRGSVMSDQYGNFRARFSGILDYDDCLVFEIINANKIGWKFNKSESDLIFEFTCAEFFLIPANPNANAPDSSSGSEVGPGGGAGGGAGGGGDGGDEDKDDSDDDDIEIDLPEDKPGSGGGPTYSDKRTNSLPLECARLASEGSTLDYRGRPEDAGFDINTGVIELPPSSLTLFSPVPCECVGRQQNSNVYYQFSVSRTLPVSRNYQFQAQGLCSGGGNRGGDYQPSLTVSTRFGTSDLDRIKRSSATNIRILATAFQGIAAYSGSVGFPSQIRGQFFIDIPISPSLGINPCYSFIQDPSIPIHGAIRTTLMVYYRERVQSHFIPQGDSFTISTSDTTVFSSRERCAFKKKEIGEVIGSRWLEGDGLGRGTESSTSSPLGASVGPPCSNKSSPDQNAQLLPFWIAGSEPSFEVSPPGGESFTCIHAQIECVNTAPSFRFFNVIEAVLCDDPEDKIEFGHVSDCGESILRGPFVSQVFNWEGEVRAVASITSFASDMKATCPCECSSEENVTNCDEDPCSQDCVAFKKSPGYDVYYDTPNKEFELEDAFDENGEKILSCTANYNHYAKAKAEDCGATFIGNFYYLVGSFERTIGVTAGPPPPPSFDELEFEDGYYGIPNSVGGEQPVYLEFDRSDWYFEDKDGNPPGDLLVINGQSQCPATCEDFGDFTNSSPDPCPDDQELASVTRSIGEKASNGREVIWEDLNCFTCVDVTPTETPTEEPTGTPTEEPTGTPTEEPTGTPTEEPTETPTPECPDFATIHELDNCENPDNFVDAYLEDYQGVNLVGSVFKRGLICFRVNSQRTVDLCEVSNPAEIIISGILDFFGSCEQCENPTGTPTEEPTGTPTEEPTGTPTEEPYDDPTAGVGPGGDEAFIG